MRRIFASAVLLGILLPFSALALEGIGPRITVTGAIEDVTVTEQNKRDEFGGELKLRATNGQPVTILLGKDTEFIAEGRAGRKPILPENLTVGMEMRVRGWRQGTNAMKASLVIIANVNLNPALTTSGILQAIGTTNVTIMGQNGVVSSYELSNETDVSINYALRGMEGLTLIGKQVQITVNPNNPAQARAIRINGNKEEALLKPTTIQFGRRAQ